jgi:hypothetical protein
MSMKTHLIAALREMFDAWEYTLADMSEAQITTEPEPGVWSVQDDLAHLWAWQQRTTARLEAALHDHPPVMPAFLSGVDLVTEDNVHEVNARLQAAYGGQPWAKVYQDWRSGFLKLLDTVEQLSEKDLLNWEKYPWLGGFSLADILIGTYDHHQEHLETLQARG